MKLVGLLVLVTATITACGGPTVQVPDATFGFVVSRSSTHFLVRYVPSTSVDAQVKVFDLAPNARGGTLITSTLWGGRMEVLTTDCAVVDQLSVRGGSDNYAVVSQNGEASEVTSADVLDGETSEALPLLPGTCGSPNE